MPEVTASGLFADTSLELLTTKVMKNEIRIFSPATVANVACGFDVLGFCLDSQGDEMVIRKTKEKGIKITHIEGYNLPYETAMNVAGVFSSRHVREC